MVEFERVTDECKNLVAGLIETYDDGIKRAYMKGQGTFTVNLSLKLNNDGEDIKVKAGISFTEGVVKDTVESIVSDQQDLPGVS